MNKPGRKCQVCNAAEFKLTIDQRLRDGATCREIAQEFGFSEDSVQRHRSSHMLKASESVEPTDMLHSIVEQFGELAATCKLQNDARGTLGALTKQLSAATTLLERQHPSTTRFEKMTLEQKIDDIFKGNRIPIQVLDRIALIVGKPESRGEHADSVQ